jgi:hypothetical protein
MKHKTRDYRERMRAAGLRPIEIWVPDVRSKSFKPKLRRQVASLDPRLESEAMDFIETVESDA